MILFENFYDLWIEKSIVPVDAMEFDSIPVKNIGLYNRVVYLPVNKPYGFWMDRHGNFIPVSSSGDHKMKAQKILESANRYMKNKIDLAHPEISYYEVLFDLGWVRIVTANSRRKLYYEKSVDRTMSNTQVKNLKFMQEFYELTSIEEG